MSQPVLIRLPRVEAATGLSRSTIYRKINEKTFPAPISLGRRASAWVESEITQWIEQRIAESRNVGDKP